MNNETTKPTYYAGTDGKDLITRMQEGLLTEEETKGFMKGNVLKYVIRAGKKSDSPLEDLNKAKTYIERLIKFETELADREEVKANTDWLHVENESVSNEKQRKFVKGDK